MRREVFPHRNTNTRVSEGLVMFVFIPSGSSKNIVLKAIVCHLVACVGVPRGLIIVN